MSLGQEHVGRRDSARHLRALDDVGGRNEAANDDLGRAPPELNLRMFAGLRRYLLEVHGEDMLERVSRRARLTPEDFTKSSCWGSLSQVQSVLEDVRQLAGSDEEFQKACTYKIKEGYGLLRFALMASTPKAIFNLATSTFENVSRISRYTTEFPEPGFAVARYESDCPESRLMCLSRQAHARALPTLWGLPPAHLVEDGCIAHGDEACVYAIRWYLPRRWVLTLAGALLGGAIGIGVSMLWQSTVAVSAVSVLIGALLAEVWQLRSRNRDNLATGEDINAALRSLLTEHTQARQEILGLHNRQREWTRTLEHQVKERTQRLEAMVDRLRQLEQVRETNVRGVSHDLRNPLFLLLAETEVLRRRLDAENPEDRELVSLHEQAVDQMQALVNEMMASATEDLASRRHSPEPMDVSPIIDVLRGRVAALAYGKDVRTSCFATREAPSQIWCHPLVFDRIVDNLITNAVKYTERGSVVIELDGTPGYLTIKISDTGCGVPAAKIRQIFEPGASAEMASPMSYGVGLSVVIELLDELGGRLEVQSTDGVGTTFWAHFPTKVMGHRSADEPDSLIDRVVTIRAVYESSSDRPGA